MEELFFEKGAESAAVAPRSNEYIRGTYKHYLEAIRRQFISWQQSGLCMKTVSIKSAYPLPPSRFSSAIANFRSRHFRLSALVDRVRQTFSRKLFQSMIETLENGNCCALLTTTLVDRRYKIKFFIVFRYLKERSLIKIFTLVCEKDVDVRVTIFDVTRKKDADRW